MLKAAEVEIKKELLDSGFWQTLVMFELWGVHEEHSLPDSRFS